MSTHASSFEGSIRGTERQRLQALVAADLALARLLDADDYELVTPGGATQSSA